MMTTLAQGGRGVPTELWLWVGVLIVASLVFGVVVIAMRRRLLGPGGASSAPGSMLDELREMYTRGEISKEEYDTTRATIAARAAGKAPPEGARPTTPRAPDGTLAARPGYDLTGERLPPRAAGDTGDPDAGANTPGGPDPDLAE